MLHQSVSVAGVIVNRVGSEGHYRLLKAAIETACNIPVVGYLLADDEIRIPERHLGLIPAIERGELSGLFDRLADVVSSTIDLDHLITIARNAPPLDYPTETYGIQTRSGPVVMIAVAKDAAFNFYYPENRELLETGSGSTEGFVSENVMAGYSHLHFVSYPKIAQQFVDACAAYHSRVK